ncbi:hypothetical protein H9L10_14160 [Phycicoccus endophyticus]|uniref:Uncharacterized protein n=1 Tax=Phycicoccus endophyticus TaxID=1690220 RepID=A0A7G9R155_9MICO|nr:hypothetical protein [Phycicoccus endophyticus]NHI20539.1 hypothetical protein [Phycicoccus endophyticus]QNN49330.1 hypothetical protein H9L10_14160 [Phycicoccus endophyticus]
MSEDQAVGRTSSGTVVVLAVAAVLTVMGIGSLLAQWDRLTRDSLFGLAALSGALLPLVALLWGVRKARRERLGPDNRRGPATSPTHQRRG